MTFNYSINWFNYNYFRSLSLSLSLADWLARLSSIFFPCVDAFDNARVWSYTGHQNEVKNRKKNEEQFNDTPVDGYGTGQNKHHPARAKSMKNAKRQINGRNMLRREMLRCLGDSDSFVLASAWPTFARSIDPLISIRFIRFISTGLIMIIVFFLFRKNYYNKPEGNWWCSGLYRVCVICC